MHCAELHPLPPPESSEHGFQTHVPIGSTIAGQNLFTELVNIFIQHHLRFSYRIMVTQSVMTEKLLNMLKAVLDHKIFPLYQCIEKCVQH